MDNCIFCKINNGDMSSYSVFQDEFIHAILDINPANEGHILVIPKKHYVNIFDIEDEYLEKIIACVKSLSNRLKDVYGYENINIVQSTGVVAGQEINHFHFHIMPRKEGDNVNFTYKTDIEAKNHLSDTLNKLTFNNDDRAH